MPNTYVIKAVIGGASGYISIHKDSETVVTKEAARHFDSLLSADSYAVYLDLAYPDWTHIVEPL